MYIAPIIVITVIIVIVKISIYFYCYFLVRYEVYNILYKLIKNNINKKKYSVYVIKQLKHIEDINPYNIKKPLTLQWI
jgi:hypothetical protein